VPEAELQIARGRWDDFKAADGRRATQAAACRRPRPPLKRTGLRLSFLVSYSW
jgi:hypothetical protein